ncbi:triacylglycerol lipase [Blastococcus sp. Marseille-P5729]|uniref:esterase/lipase family protein n=1 Tax=Blastococcus sp. Marseille-P5729 TaxID=2086582 RepID=UPI00131D5803|nr:alpha/beta fold hydrolase [Blastococcus sp. Marseille-P5729]
MSASSVRWRISPVLLVFGLLVALTAPIIAARPAFANQAYETFVELCPSNVEGSSDVWSEMSSGGRVVVLVHGWTASASDMQQLGENLLEREPDLAIFLFDYSKSNGRWADEPGTSDCLALFIEAVSESHRAVGGSGKVVIVAHSMGGILARFALNDVTNGGVGQPASPDRVGAVITIDTPHRGSPFGGTLAEFKQAGELFYQTMTKAEDIGAVPHLGTRAATCLSLYDDQHPLPAGCARPPYLPEGIPVIQIQGRVIVEKLLFGFPIPNNDIDLLSDGIVGDVSQHGYNASAGSPQPKPGVGSAMHTIACRVSSDELVSGKGLEGAARDFARLAGAGLELVGDGADLFASLFTKKVGDAKYAALGVVASQSAPCGHSRIVNHPDVAQRVVDTINGLALDPPSQGQTLDVEPFGGAQFSSPLGSLTCALEKLDDDPGAICDLTAGASAIAPTWQEVCPDGGGSISPGWIVLGDKAGWMCAGGIASWPVNQAWNAGGFGEQIVKDGFTYDVLPYGKTLKYGNISCAMAKDGVTCSNSVSGAAFKLNSAGVTFTG